MEEGRQKSKRLSYTAKFKCEVIQCAEEKGNRKATAIFGIVESNVQLWWKHKTAISRCEASRRKFTGPKKRRFPEIDDAVFTFFQERRKTGLFVSYDLLHEEAINKIINHCIVLFFRHVQRLYHFSKIQLSTMNLIRTHL
jgi:hypothetical protein